VGIAIPAYRSAATLEATLRSCIDQTLTSWIAYVTVEGTEAHEEKAIVDRLGDDRIRLRVNGAQLGQPWNFNRATLACYGEGVPWVKLLSADDVLYPDALERMVALGETRPSCGLVYGYFDEIDTQGRLVGKVDLGETPSKVYGSSEFFHLVLPIFNPMGGPSSVMLRREAIERAGLFDDRFPWGMDQVLWYRVIRTFDVGVVGERPVLAYRFHDNSVTGRTFRSTKRYSDPINLMHDVCLDLEPYSRDWWTARSSVGQAIGAGLLTSLGVARRGMRDVAMLGAVTSLRHLTPSTVPGLAHFLATRVVRHALGRPLGPTTPLAPPVRREPVT
jgi:glycosyltransferase involved in cell wall biosynthesis